MIQKSITMTSKGTFTLPAKVRQAMGVKNSGDKLMLTFHEKSGTVELTKGVNLKALQDEITALLHKKFPDGIPPLDMDAIRELKHQEAIRRHRDSLT